MWEFAIGAVCSFYILQGCLSFHANLKDIDYDLYTTEEECKASFIEIMKEKTPNVVVFDTTAVYTAECRHIGNAT